MDKVLPVVLLIVREFLKKSTSGERKLLIQYAALLMAIWMLLNFVLAYHTGGVAK